ncbi:hypothetical protein Q0590_36125 [Rhodocytophaga aerolata]|uniref:DUF4352 domain-containing protein n=1 Tax=Rhodocytophaga aerolata TaxID=455078 RepID=A0ABT8RI34_9BACT|nr:hypothetical protein [Rhodocytophaga aerolata]MDO1451758.1 hypothetical protein [Rhodocytophaga aerolata]
MNRYKVLLIGLVLVAGVVLTSMVVKYYLEHPILLKYATFTARNLGTPLQADVYTDEKLNDSIKVFSNGDSSILLYLSDTPQIGRVIMVNWEHNMVGIPSGATMNDYDFFWGQLFQSEVGRSIAPFNSVKINHSFNPKLIHRGNEITFIIAPPTDEEFKYRFRTVKIIMKSNS